MPIKFAINGFGRIGRAITRQWLAGLHPAFELVAINDIAAADSCAYLLEYDSIYGPLGMPVTPMQGAMQIGSKRVRLSHKGDVAQVDLSDVDIVFECTGKTNTRAKALAGQRAGAAQVLISGPCAAADITLIEGANHQALTGQSIVSNGSCTTNALAPLLYELDTAFGLQSAHITTIHCYTGSQPTIDAPRGGALERNRAAALSMVPSSTSAMGLVEKVLPHLAPRISGGAVRVPTASVSAIDLVCTLSQKTSAQAVNAHLSSVAPYLIGAIDQPLVSSDLRGRRESFILARPQTRLIQDSLLRTVWLV